MSKAMEKITTIRNNISKIDINSNTITFTVKEENKDTIYEYLNDMIFLGCCDMSDGSHGYWSEKAKNRFECSVCGEIHTDIDDICPHCKSKMDL